MSENADPEDLDERRYMNRYPSGERALVFRDCDAMRTGLVVTLRDVSVNGLGLSSTTPIELNETIKIEVRNEIQRFKKMVRGVVVYSLARDKGEFHIGIALNVRLTPLEVSILSTKGRNKTDSPDGIWM